MYRYIDGIMKLDKCSYCRKSLNLVDVESAKCRKLNIRAGSTVGHLGLLMGPYSYNNVVVISNFIIKTFLFIPSPNFKQTCSATVLWEFFQRSAEHG